MRRSIPIVLLIFFIFSFILFLTPKNSFAPGLIGFIQRVFASPKSWLYSSLTDKTSIGELEKQNKKLTEKMLDYDRLKQDNIALRSQFQDHPFETQKLLPVHIVGFHGQPGYPTAFVIDAGYTSGIKNGMIAILGKNFIGKVKNISPRYAEVLLPTGTNFSMLAITTAHNTPGIVNGAGDIVLFNNVSITDTLTRGDLITTKGEIDPNGDGAPPGFIIGTISQVDKNDTRPFQSGIIKPSVNYAKLNLIFVVLK